MNSPIGVCCVFVPASTRTCFSNSCVCWRSRHAESVVAWAHARRKFYEAKDNDAARSHVAMAHIRRLYAIEKEARELVAARKLEGVVADAVVLELRQNKSVAELDTLKTWLDAEQSKVLPKSLIGL